MSPALPRLRRPCLSAGLAGLIAAGLAACAKPPVTPEIRGRAVFASYSCSRCHRIGDSGGTTGPDLTYIGFRKTAAFLDIWLKDPSAWQPSTLMPNFAFNEATRKDLVAYLSTLKGESYGTAPRPWDGAALKRDPVQRGGKIYALVGCATCHGKEGVGGYPNNNVIGGKIPALTGVASGYTQQELIEKISRGVPRPVKADSAGPDPLLTMPAWGEVLNPEEIQALAEYLLSLKPKNPSETW